jgi:hypothetical protein
VVCIPSDLTSVGQSAHGRRIYRIHSQDEDDNCSRGIRRPVEWCLGLRPPTVQDEHYISGGRDIRDTLAQIIFHIIASRRRAMRDSDEHASIDFDITINRNAQDKDHHRYRTGTIGEQQHTKQPIFFGKLVTEQLFLRGSNASCERANCLNSTTSSAIGHPRFLDISSSSLLFTSTFNFDTNCAATSFLVSDWMVAEQLFLRPTTCSCEQRDPGVITNRELYRSLQRRYTIEDSNHSESCSWVVYTICCGTQRCPVSALHPRRSSIINTRRRSFIYPRCCCTGLHAGHSSIAHSWCCTIASNKCASGSVISRPIIRPLLTSQLCCGFLGFRFC